MALLPIAAALLITPNVLTPEGPATLRATFVAPVPHARFGPRVVVRWSVRVGEGSAAGPVALRVMRGDPATGDSFGRGPVEFLPASPGVHEFPVRLGILDGQVLGLDQQTGGHAIVTTEAHPDDAVDVWRPPLGTNDSRRDFERRRGERLLISAAFEPDVDEDGYGDRTQDENDLALSARARRRSVRVRVRNLGDRRVHRPQVRFGRRTVEVRPIASNGARTVVVRGLRRGYRVRLVAGSEGFDPTPASLVVRAPSG